MMSTIRFHSKLNTGSYPRNSYQQKIIRQLEFAIWENCSFHTFGVRTLQYHVVRVKCYATNWLWFYFNRTEHFGIFWPSFIHSFIRLRKKIIANIFSGLSNIRNSRFCSGLVGFLSEVFVECQRNSLFHFVDCSLFENVILIKSGAICLIQCLSWVKFVVPSTW